MNLARQYLLDTDKTIQEVADAVGYEHQSHFSTAFKRKFRMSPQAFRRCGDVEMWRCGDVEMWRCWGNTLNTLTGFSPLSEFQALPP
jgi:AraC-like DNA-binding protein